MSRSESQVDEEDPPSIYRSARVMPQVEPTMVPPRPQVAPRLVQGCHLWARCHLWANQLAEDHGPEAAVAAEALADSVVTSPIAITRDLGRAREAYAKKSVAASRAAHDGSSSSITTTGSSSSCSFMSEGSATDLLPTREIILGMPDGATCGPEKHSNTPSKYIKSMVSVHTHT
eukprot:scaffold133445_cov67-Phaeocystis_antarctica.AAC.6